MRIQTNDDTKFTLEVDEGELDTLMFLCHFCLGGVPDEHEYQAIKMIGQYENFTEDRNQIKGGK